MGTLLSGERAHACLTACVSLANCEAARTTTLYHESALSTGVLSRPLNHFDRKLACAQRAHQEAAPLIRCVRLVVTPSAERCQLIEVEVGAALRAFDHVVDIETPAHTTGLTASAHAREHLRPDSSPLGAAGSATTQRTGSAGSHPARGRSA
jgi:hypothetical protein